MGSPSGSAGGGTSSGGTSSAGSSNGSDSSSGSSSGRSESSSDSSFSESVSSTDSSRDTGGRGSHDHGDNDDDNDRDRSSSSSGPSDDPGLTPSQSEALAESAAVMDGFALSSASAATPDLAEPEDEESFVERAGDALVGTAQLAGGVAVGAAETAWDGVVGAAGLAWEGVEMVNDAAGTVLDTAVGWTGIDTFEGHAQRNQERGQAIVDGVMSVPELPGKIADAAVEGWETFEDNWEAGNYYAAGKQIGGAGLEVATVAVPVAKAGSLSKISKLDDVADVTTTVNRQLDDLYSAAPAAKIEIDNLAHEIATDYDARVAEAPLKSRERAVEKTTIEYGGDASRLNDIARNTIVASQDDIASITAELESRGAKVKTITPESNPLGYSGVNTVIDTDAGIRAEIQVNTPDMVYAKEPESVARSILGDDVYDEIAERTGIEGGRGHALYEERRSLDESDIERALEIEQESRDYYRNFQ